MKIPALHLQPVDKKVGDEYVPDWRRRIRPLARIRCAIAAGELVTTAMWQGKLLVPFTQPAEIIGQIEQPLCNQMNDVSFPLNPAIDCQHRS